MIQWMNGVPEEAISFKWPRSINSRIIAFLPLRGCSIVEENTPTHSTMLINISIEYFYLLLKFICVCIWNIHNPKICIFWVFNSFHSCSWISCQTFKLVFVFENIWRMNAACHSWMEHFSHLFWANVNIFHLFLVYMVTKLFVHQNIKYA